MAERIRELRAYSEDDDDTSVNIVAHPGAVVHVRGSRPDSDPPMTRKKPDWPKLIAAAVAALTALAALGQQLYEALK